MAKDPICGMHVDERNALSFSAEGKNYFFCSRHCLDRFLKERHIKLPAKYASAGCKGRAWYMSKTLITASALLFLCVLSYFLPFLSGFRSNLFAYIAKIWWAVILGFFLGGVIDHFVPREYISKALAKPKKRTIFYSVMLGFLMSACSHGIIALSVELHKKGASNPSVIAFLLASPWANFTLTIMLLGFFGIKALYIIFSAVLIAFITGIIYQLLDAKGLIEKNPNTKDISNDFSISHDIRARAGSYKLSYAQVLSDVKGVISGALSLADMVLWWLLIGIGAASLIAAFVPQHFFMQYMGPNLLGLLVTLIFAAVLEVCSEGTSPLAFEIYRQTGAFGNALVFLMAGVATDYTEIGIVWANIGRRTALWLPAIAVPQIIILGIIANLLF